LTLKKELQEQMSKGVCCITCRPVKVRQYLRRSKLGNVHWVCRSSRNYPRR